MQEAEIGRIAVPGQPRPKRKVCKTLSIDKRWVWSHIPVTPATVGNLK
jgi:hypothetical protein